MHRTPAHHPPSHEPGSVSQLLVGQNLLDVRRTDGLLDGMRTLAASIARDKPDASSESLATSVLSFLDAEEGLAEKIARESLMLPHTIRTSRG